MARYSLRIKRSAEKELRNIPKSHRNPIIAKILLLADQPHPPGSEKLSGRDAYRIRIGVYRVVYTIQDAILEVEVIKIAHRKQVYR